MRRLVGLYKVYDVVELTEDVPESGLKKGDQGVVVDIGIGRGTALMTIELYEEFQDDERDQLPSLRLEYGKQPPIRIIDVLDFPAPSPSFNVFPDDHRFVNIVLPRELPK